MYRAVLFDVDGTLVDSVDLHAQAWQDTLRSFGQEAPLEKIREQISKGGDQLLPVFFSQDQIQSQGEEIRNYRKDLFRRQYLTRVKPFPQVRELLERLKTDGQKIALASCATKEELVTYKRLTGIEGLPDAEAFGDEADQSKPEPDILLTALHRLGTVEREEVIVVGDSFHDAEVAGKAGLRTIGLLCGGASAEQLRSAGCREVYRDPAELLKQYNHSLLAEASYCW